MGNNWAKVEQLTLDQHGVVTRAQLEARSFNRHQIDNALKRGVLVAIFPGAYAFFGAPQTWETRAMAATLLGGDDVALSHHSAASVYGLDGAGLTLSLHVSVPTSRSARFGRGVTIHRPSQPFTVTQVKKLPVTSLERTVFDLAASLPESNVEALLDSARLVCASFGEGLRETCTRLAPRYHGARLINRLLKDRLGSKTESWLEQQVGRQMKAFGIAAWAEQTRLFDGDGFISRVDFTWPAHKVVLHADGYRWHRSRAQFDRDAEQRSRLEAQGWAAQIVTTTALQNDDWLKRLAGLLALRAPRRERQTSNGR